jgi:glutamate carboxypeptidase
MSLPFSIGRLHDYLRHRQPAMVNLLRALVQRESPSHDKVAVDRLAGFLGGEWRQRGARVKLIRPRTAGAILRAEVKLGRGKPQGQLLVLGHLDTVYAVGTLEKMPFRVRGGRAFGPGVFDMKGGIVQGLFALEAVQELEMDPVAPRKIVFLFTSDEEIGSEAGRRVLEREARRSRAVLVLEPSAGANGALKTARKGVGEFEVIVEGRAAHAGLEPEKGVNAIEELARQIIRLKKLARPRQGLTLNVDVIEGGTRTNVVADRARALVDARVTRKADGPRVERAMRKLKPVDKRAKLVIAGGINRPPLERTAQGAQLFRQARALGRELGLSLKETAVGGGSDGNFTGALGVPTLDGLGTVGGGAHSPGEFIVVDNMLERAALVAGLLLTV